MFLNVKNYTLSAYNFLSSQIWGILKFASSQLTYCTSTMASGCGSLLTFLTLVRKQTNGL